MAVASSKKLGRVVARRVAWGVGIIAALLFAVEGGEYGTRDLWSQRFRKDSLERELAQLRLEVDSLRTELKSVTTDDARLERIAREKYGMVRGSKELLYRIGVAPAAASDSSKAGVDTSVSREFK